MNPEANGEISNEFFKKLNQQIVQKDNLIKLLQLQIRNLKTQIEAGGSDSEELVQLKKALEEKSSETERLLAELEDQKGQFSELEQKKNEEIQALSQMLEEHQANSSAVAEVVEDPRVEELEQLVSTLREELEQSRQAAEALQTELANAANAAAEMQTGETGVEVQMALDASQAELAQLSAAYEELKAQLMAKEEELASAAGDTELESYKNRVLELEQDVANLKNIIAEKDEAAVAGSSDSSAGEALAAVQAENAALIAEIEAIRAELQASKDSHVIPVELSDELERLRQETAEVDELKAKIEQLSHDANAYAEAAIKITALESEREQLADEIENLKNAGGSSSEETASLRHEIERLREIDKAREDELARLRVAAESRQDDSMSDPAIREEVEQLTRQVADQLLAIQNFEGMIGKTRDQLQRKDTEIENLKARLASAGAPAGAGIGDSEIITSFIDFFDGLDSLLSKNPLPELQALHQKLLERLIIPNQIAYMQVISEEFDPEKHIATDYFRSTKFPERCIVFEVEKGYRKGDMVIKKSKVWVVQNLFSCQACGATSNPDSRFCHLCGAKIAAPNGLPVDSLPEFEPSPTTYQRFAERLLERDDHEKAREYILAGLELDPNFVPLLVMYADILTADSQFEEAMAQLKKAFSLKPASKTQEKIQALETKLTIFRQAKNLKLSPEEFEKLLHLIQK